MNGGQKGGVEGKGLAWPEEDGNTKENIKGGEVGEKTKGLLVVSFLDVPSTINLSPLLVTKWGFMLIIILSNYQ